MVSSMFSNTRETIVHAATLCKFTSAGGFFGSGEATSTARAVLVFKQIAFVVAASDEIVATSLGARLASGAKFERHN